MQVSSGYDASSSRSSNENAVKARRKKRRKKKKKAGKLMRFKYVKIALVFAAPRLVRDAGS